MESDDSEAELDVPSGDPGFLNRSLLGMYGKASSSNQARDQDDASEALEVDGEAATDASQVGEAGMEGRTGGNDMARNGPTNGLPEPAAVPAVPATTSSSSTANKPRETKPKPKKSTALSSAKDRAALAAKYPPPSSRLRDMGGIDALIPEILRVILLPFAHSEIHTHLGIMPPRGVLLHGPPGCGKTMLAGAIAGELGVPFINVSAPSVVGGMSGESEKRIREIFDEAKVGSFLVNVL